MRVLLGLTLALVACTSAPDLNAPQVRLMVSHSEITTGESVTLTAIATDDQSVLRVDFYKNGLLMGSDNVAPYSISDAPSSEATYRARAYDTSNNYGQSNFITVSVKATNPVQRYRGEWLWVALFNDGSGYEGFLSISQALPNTTDSRGIEGGVWRWCTVSVQRCPTPSGTGLLGELRVSGRWLLSGGFSDDRQIKAVFLDSDNRIGNEVQGRPTVLGDGRWYFYSGLEEDFEFAMAKISDTPTYTQRVNPVRLPPELYQSFALHSNSKAHRWLEMRLSQIE